uniref:CS domain-containing protein n=1 Tax=Meloidogyne hapla TaxID=6305 RepID=A0A1I8BKI5_MELHA
MVTYYPFVYWAQDVNNIFLKVEVGSLVNYQLSVVNNGRLLLFQGIGIPQGIPDADLSDFEFQLPLASSVLESFVSTKIERGLNVTLKKQNAGFWKNGLVNPEYKLQTKNWLRFNFDKWKDDPEDIDEEDVSFEGEDVRKRKNTHLEEFLTNFEKGKEVNISNTGDFYWKIFGYLGRIYIFKLINF